jgi:hypothetical protein
MGSTAGLQRPHSRPFGPRAAPLAEREPLDPLRCDADASYFAESATEEDLAPDTGTCVNIDRDSRGRVIRPSVTGRDWTRALLPFRAAALHRCPRKVYPYERYWGGGGGNLRPPPPPPPRRDVAAEVPLTKIDSSHPCAVRAPPAPRRSRVHDGI